MLTSFAILAAVLLVGAALIQWAISVWFRRWFTKRSSNRLPVDRQKKTAVLMSVRGCDPSLGESLRGLLDQEYGDYEIHLVVDHRSDQAWDFVHAIKQEHDRRDLLTIHEMRNPRETCSLKCHAIVQALEGIGDDIRLVAFIDADMIPHRTWLAELVGPLEDASIGGVTGGQWFEPPAPAGMGSLVRSAWNGGAMVPTIIFSNPWAGSFALRLEDLRRSNLNEIWSRSAVDDGPISDAINGIGLRIEFAPSLIMVNREACTFSYVNRWVTRMLTWSRVYEKTFFLSVIHALFSNAVMMANFVVMGMAVATGAWVAGGISAAGLVISGVLSVAAYGEARKCVAYSCTLRGESIPKIPFARWVGVFSLVAVAQWVYGVSCCRAMLVRRIRWREIDYEIGGAQEIKRLNYQPYLPGSEKHKSKVSI